MSQDPVLLVGGAGIAGGWAAKFLREFHPDLPLLIGGRDADRAAKAAADLGNAEGVAVDLSQPDLGLGDRPVAAVAVFFTDRRVACLNFAQDRGVPYLNIAPALFELAPETAAFIQRPDAAPVVLATEWMVGTTSMAVMKAARAFDRIDSLTVGALLDEDDQFGPSALGDYERQTGVMDAALIRREGVFEWIRGEDAQSRITALDGTEIPATAAAFNDVPGLATALNLPNMRFDMAFGVTSSRRRGEAPSTEILIEMTGTDREGRPLTTRHGVMHPQGQMPLTGFGAAMLVERLLGLDGGAPVPAGLYFPYRVLDVDGFLDRLDQIGGSMVELPPR